VQRLVKIVSLVMLGLWLPATLHCRLETLGFEGLFGCPEQGSAKAHQAGENDCDRDSCQSVESGHFVFSKTKIVPASLPTLGCNFVFCLLHVIPPPTETPIFSCAQNEPLPLQRTWQFTRRAALPARAPDALNT
jgi:hypothetical protein